MPGRSSAGDPPIVAAPLPARTYSTSSSALLTFVSPARRAEQALLELLASARGRRTAATPRPTGCKNAFFTQRTWENLVKAATVGGPRRALRQTVRTSARLSGRNPKGGKLMVRRVGWVAIAAFAAVLAIVSAAAARPSAQAAATASCTKGVSIGMQAPITGPAGSIGADQLHWAQFYFTQWNKSEQAQDPSRPGGHAARSVEGVDDRAGVSPRTRRSWASSARRAATRSRRSRRSSRRRVSRSPPDRPPACR